jgi:glycosyltransferase involved in cell wall biosynthesis
MTNTLVISTELPAGPMTGGRIRTDQLARALAQLGPLTIAGFTIEDEPVPALAPPLRAVGVPWEQPPLYVQMYSADASASQLAYRLLAEGVPEPWIVSAYESSRMRETIRELCTRGVDLVVLEHSLMGAYLAQVPSHVPVVLDLHNVHWRAAQRAADRGLEQAREVDRVRDYERALIQHSALTIVVSDAEAAAARELVPEAHVEVVPNGVDTSFFVPAATAGHSTGYMLFTGLMNYAPNVEAVSWFANEILPLIDRAVLHVVGSTPSEEVKALASQRLLVHGEVPDTRPYEWQADVVVVPLLSGAGTRLKILEAAACGNAIVSTELGAEGLGFKPGHDLLIANSAAEFARAVTAVLTNDALRAGLGRNARRASENYRWEAIGERLRGLVRPLTEGDSSQPRAKRRPPQQVLAGEA